MGAVYEAADLRLTRRVAVKVMVGALFGDRTALRRFEREAQAAASLSHPNIIGVYDYGPVGADGAFLVMELVDGRTWRQELERSGAIEPAIASTWFDQVLGGLQAAHEAGVVHRDLKPENLLLAGGDGRAPVIKILDFGLAKVVAADVAATGTATMPGVVLGTYGYMAPEQLSGQAVDRRADLFAIGVLAVETVTGRRPFTGATFPELLRSLLQDEFRLEGQGESERRLDSVLQRCLAKDPVRRYDSAAALRRDLVPALSACPPLDAAGGPRMPADMPTR
jgi:serine/threonine-protein kinase